MDKGRSRKPSRARPLQEGKHKFTALVATCILALIAGSGIVFTSLWPTISMYDSALSNVLHSTAHLEIRDAWNSLRNDTQEGTFWLQSGEQRNAGRLLPDAGLLSQGGKGTGISDADIFLQPLTSVQHVRTEQGQEVQVAGDETKGEPGSEVEASASLTAEERSEQETPSRPTERSNELNELKLPLPDASEAKGPKESKPKAPESESVTLASAPNEQKVLSNEVTNEPKVPRNDGTRGTQGAQQMQGGTREGQQLPEPPEVGETQCSCYNVKTRVCPRCYQGLCVCSNMCFNSQQWIYLGGGAPQCRPATSAAEGSVLAPIPCNPAARFAGFFRRNFQEAALSLARRPLAWLASRANATWQRESTYLQAFDSPSGNIYHFTPKATFLLLLNGANGALHNDSDGLLEPALRALLVRSPPFLRRLRALGPRGFHATLLHSLLQLAFADAPAPATELPPRGPSSPSSTLPSSVSSNFSAASAVVAGLESLGKSNTQLLPFQGKSSSGGGGGSSSSSSRSRRSRRRSLLQAPAGGSGDSSSATSAERPSGDFGRFEPSDLLGDGLVLGGRVSFEGALRSASEEEPICFRQLIVPGVMKGMAYPGGRPMRARLVAQLARTLNLHEEDEDEKGGGGEGEGASLASADFAPGSLPGPASASASLEASGSLGESGFLEASASNVGDATEGAAMKAGVDTGGAIKGALPGGAAKTVPSREPAKRAPSDSPDKLASSSSGGGNGGGGGGGGGDGPIRLLHIVRSSNVSQGRRIFEAESAAALAAMLGGGSGGAGLGMEVRHLELQGLSMQRQVAAIRAADVVLALHGAGLQGPVLLARSHAVIIEISPFKVLHTSFYKMAVNAGGNYLTHQCQQGRPKGHDALYGQLSMTECQADRACKRYFFQHRDVELTPGDLAELRRLLLLAARLAALGRRAAAGGRGGGSGKDGNSGDSGSEGLVRLREVATAACGRKPGQPGLLCRRAEEQCQLAPPANRPLPREELGGGQKGQELGRGRREWKKEEVADTCSHLTGWQAGEGLLPARGPASHLAGPWGGLTPGRLAADTCLALLGLPARPAGASPLGRTHTRTLAEREERVELLLAPFAPARLLEGGEKGEEKKGEEIDEVRVCPERHQLAGKSSSMPRRRHPELRSCAFVQGSGIRARSRPRCAVASWVWEEVEGPAGSLSSPLLAQEGLVIAGLPQLCTLMGRCCQAAMGATWRRFSSRCGDARWQGPKAECGV